MFTKPYNDKGRCRFLYKEFGNKSGVYIIKEKEEIVYIGMSGVCVYTTAYRHFQSWADNTQKRVTYDRDSEDMTLSIMLTEDSATIERQLIQKYKPRDNTVLYISDKFSEDINAGCWEWEEHKRMENIIIPF